MPRVTCKNVNLNVASKEYFLPSLFPNPSCGRPTHKLLKRFNLRRIATRIIGRELASHSACLLDGIHELGRPRLGNPSQVVLQLVLGHTDTRVLDDEGLGVLRDGVLVHTA